MEEEEKENCLIGEDLCSRLNDFHAGLMQHVSLKALLAPPEEEVSVLPTFCIIYILYLYCLYCSSAGL